MIRGVLARHRALVGIAALVVVFAAFEVGVRLLPPDAMQYTVETVNPAGPGAAVSGTITGSVMVARWRAAMTAKPDELLIASYLAAAGAACAGGTYSVATYTFTWHGLPVEVVSTGPKGACGPDEFQVWRGVIPDWYTYSFPEPEIPSNFRGVSPAGARAFIPMPQGRGLQP